MALKQEPGDEKAIQTKMASVSAKRSMLDIVWDILSSIPEEGIRRTPLANRAMIDFKVMDKYLKLLLSEGFVTMNSSNGKIYITSKGREFLEEYKRFKCLFEKAT
uniref:ArnR1-like winged helix-turn-helix domain-containing protein n=1 Tax=Fervidicoccus fontis TaxID=683846 RepID=A0A7J3ZJB0_9CREN